MIAPDPAPSPKRSPCGFVLVLNGGSSSLKFALFEGRDGAPRRVASGKFDRIGLGGGSFSVKDATTGASERRPVEVGDHAACIGPIVDWLEARLGDPGLLQAIGHRVVHGGPRYHAPEAVTAELLAELRRLSPYDPEHLPAEIDLIEAISRRYPGLPQVACFDTAFHHGLPPVARLLPIPRRYAQAGVYRYGFHGLSYAYLMAELERQAGAEAAAGRVVLAHLGNGASMAAVLAGKSIDTTMGFTPTAGLPMSSRSGDLNPGLVSYLARTEGMTAEEFHEMVNSRSGLLGLSETSSDVRDLLERESADPRAAEALAVFCYQARKAVAGLAAALAGLDTLVFSGGIGENSPDLRRRICAGLGFLGVVLDPDRNAAGAARISLDSAPVAVRVIATDEEGEIAAAVLKKLESTPVSTHATRGET